MADLLGIHHITAICSDPQPNVDFYTKVLGLRLVKVTVNFDAPDTYHLYYDTAFGGPGGILTFFPWPGAPRGVVGAGEVTTIAYRIPQQSGSFWQLRLAANGIDVRTDAVDGPSGESRRLTFSDPDGMRLALVEGPTTTHDVVWTASPVPIEHAIERFSGVTMSLPTLPASVALLRNVLGATVLTEKEQGAAVIIGAAGAQAHLDLVTAASSRRGALAAGSVHHIAYRTANDADQLEWRSTLARNRMTVTPVQDRNYFHSIYFREPSGVLYEIATDPPGFAIDEPADHLGERLMLPAQYESIRSRLQAALPPLRLASGKMLF